MSDTELFYWMAFSALEPFGDDRADWHNAMSLSQQANMNRPKGRPAYKPDKFLLRFQANTRPEQNMQQMEMALRSQFFAMGGKPN